MAMTLQVLAEFSARRLGARMTILGYGFLVLILLNTYMAVLASRLTVSSIKMNIKGLSDLAAKPVGTFVDYVDLVKSRTSLLSVVPLPWDNLEDEAKMLQKLRAGEIAALLMDAPWAQYQAATSCDLYIVDTKDKVLPFNYGLGYPPDTDPTLIKDTNTAMTAMMEEGIYTAIEGKYVNPPITCPSKIAQSDLASAQVSFEQVSGLWIFLAIIMGAGWTVDLCIAGYKIYKRRRLHAAKTAAAPAGEEGDADEQPTIARSASADEGALSGKFGGGGGALSGKFGGGGGGSGKDGKDGKDAKGALASLQNARSFSTSFGSMSGFKRATSFFRRPEVAKSWMAIGEASTVEEMVELLEMQIRHMDARLRKTLPALERSLAKNQDLIESVVEALQMNGAMASGYTTGAGGAGGAGRVILASTDVGSPMGDRSVRTVGGAGSVMTDGDDTVVLSPRGTAQLPMPPSAAAGMAPSPLRNGLRASSSTTGFATTSYNGVGSGAAAVGAAFGAAQGATSASGVVLRTPSSSIRANSITRGPSRVQFTNAAAAPIGGGAAARSVGTSSGAGNAAVAQAAEGVLSAYVPTSPNGGAEGGAEGGAGAGAASSAVVSPTATMLAGEMVSARAGSSFRAISSTSVAPGGGGGFLVAAADGGVYDTDLPGSPRPTLQGSALPDGVALGASGGTGTGNGGGGGSDRGISATMLASSLGSVSGAPVGESTAAAATASPAARTVASPLGRKPSTASNL
ncbi:hypothetical protein HXX76_010679 [Chlamydomonas incerta]|uniref:Ionotropic glutamate receptor C-terminal domain-containing protein n=1 Tax=Chlamydomonas incerta TaxID=51695 RepID=A0A835VY42_CHLIN|nr:hypothetical protein HXX76_010679 [Chlamydomonas incerta]|eukprot:KAG2429899.1 hypothetical protein HXX76_010679 [Chlamydomonas incerta]